MELAALFTELSGFEFKRGEKFKGVAYKKVARTLLGHSELVTGGTQAAVVVGSWFTISKGNPVQLLLSPSLSM